MKVIYNGKGHTLTGCYTKGKVYNAHKSTGGCFYHLNDDKGKAQVEYRDNFDEVKEPIKGSNMKFVYNGLQHGLSGHYTEGKSYQIDDWGELENLCHPVDDAGNNRQPEYMDNFDEVSESIEDSNMKTTKVSPKYPNWLRPIRKLTDDVRRTIKKQKKVASMVLEQLAFLDDNAIVAGGAPRNWEQGKIANDIDVYLYVDPSRQCGHILRHLTTLFGLMNPMGATKVELGDVTQQERKDCDYDQMDIRWVFEGNIMGETVQFIIMKEPTFKSVVNRFDCSICKIWFDGYRIAGTLEYDATKDTGVIHIKDPEGKQNRHLEKMYHYYASQGYVFTKDDIDLRNPKTRNEVTPWKPFKDSSNSIPW